jgi:hypothetical protein
VVLLKIGLVSTSENLVPAGMVSVAVGGMAWPLGELALGELADCDSDGEVGCG